MPSENLNEDELIRLSALPSLNQLDFHHADNTTTTGLTDVGLSYIAEITSLHSLNMNNSSDHITNEGLAKLHNLNALRKLWLQPSRDVDCKVSDAGVASLSGLTELHDLNLSRLQTTGVGLKDFKHLTTLRVVGNPLTTEGLRTIGELEQLTILSLDSTPLTDAGLSHLENLTDITELNLEKTMITDAGMHHLKEMKKLQKLHLGNTGISDLGLEAMSVQDYKALTGLGLNSTKISDDGLNRIAEVRSLENLWLPSTEVTDTGLSSLKSLKNLKTLLLNNTRVTPQGIADLQKALPNCKVIHDFTEEEIQAAAQGSKPKETSDPAPAESDGQ